MSELKGLVENLVCYVKSDLMVPNELTVKDLAGANAAGVKWAMEVNAASQSEICAVPAERLLVETPCSASSRRCGPASASRWRSASPTARCRWSS